ncbi:MAG TPA: 6-carboxytetrahydropterin synthase [Ktedonobacterales bacterium]|nr:6-carboxytetrahydropterin synthase [Ktedonobacterales bacterium]
MSWKILIERGNLGFAAAHFITFEGECEPLHGHNYGVRVEAAGPLTADSYVLDFVVLKRIVRDLCKQWDHRFLLPLHNPHLRVTDHGDAWEIEYTGDLSAIPDGPDTPIRYVMPKWTVVPLEVDNATAERLAEQLALRITRELRRRGAGQALERLTVGIEETEMQVAFYSLDPREAPPD